MKKLRRKCTRCSIIKDSDNMHYNKQMGWMCNNRKECTESLSLVKKLMDLNDNPKDAPLYYLEKTKEYFGAPLPRQVYFVACKMALRKWHPKLTYILDNPPLYVEKLNISDIDKIISKLKSEGIR